MRRRLKQLAKVVILWVVPGLCIALWAGSFWRSGAVAIAGGPASLCPECGAAGPDQPSNDA